MIFHRLHLMQHMIVKTSSLKVLTDGYLIWSLGPSNASMWFPFFFYMTRKIQCENWMKGKHVSHPFLHWCWVFFLNARHFVHLKKNNDSDSNIFQHLPTSLSLAKYQLVGLLKRSPRMELALAPGLMHWCSFFLTSCCVGVASILKGVLRCSINQV